MLSCKQALLGRSGNGGKRRESLQSCLRNWNSTSVPPVAPRQQSCQVWPIGMEWKCVLNVNKHRNSTRKTNFPQANETPVKRWNTRKLLSSRFHRKVTVGARSKEWQTIASTCFSPWHWDNRIFCKLCGIPWTQNIVPPKVFWNKDVSNN